MTDKAPHKSKKFLAYLIAELGWKACIFYLVLQYGDKLGFHLFSLLMTVIVVSGFIQVGYILGQASLDKYIQAIKTNKSEDKG